MAEFSGHLSLLAATREHGGRTVLARQSFRAPFHISKPYWNPDTRALVVQVVNPTAGILAGDRLESQIAVDPEAALVVTTPSASRVFQMRGGAAECHQHFVVADGGWLEVMPEPLVPHRGSRYHQVTTLDIAPTGGAFFVDQLMPGRIGHGEAWAWERLCLELKVRVGGELVLQERLDQAGESLRAAAELFGSGATACFANAVLLGSTNGDSAWRQELAALHTDGVWLGVSTLRSGGWSIKLVARDAVRLRETLWATRQLLAPHFPRLRSDLRKL